MVTGDLGRNLEGGHPPVLTSEKHDLISLGLYIQLLLCELSVCFKYFCLAWCDGAHLQSQIWEQR